jgi:hypothetical protein
MTAELQEMQGGIRTGAYIPGDPDTWTPGQHSRNDKMVRYFEALREEGTLSDACKRLNVDQATVWRWRNEYPEFQADVTTFLSRDRQALLEDNLYRIATSNDPRMASATVKALEFYLKALDRPTYGDQTKVETTQTVNHMVQVVHTVRDDLRARQLERLSQLKTIDALPLSDSDNRHE